MSSIAGKKRGSPTTEGSLSRDVHANDHPVLRPLHDGCSYCSSEGVVMYLFFDPGETTGWAEFDNEGCSTGLGQLNTKELYEFLGTRYSGKTPPHIVGIEEYRILHKRLRQHAGSNVPTLRVIGAIEMAAHSWGAAVVFQPASIKKIGESWSGLKPTGSHEYSHWVDAVNHGVYYLVKNKVRDNRLVADYKSKLLQE